MWVVGFGWVHTYFGGKESRSIDCRGGVGRPNGKNLQGLVVQKLNNANPRLKINQGVYFSTSKCCSMLIFDKILH